MKGPSSVCYTRSGEGTRGEIGKLSYRAPLRGAHAAGAATQPQRTG